MEAEELKERRDQEDRRDRRSGRGWEDRRGGGADTVVMSYKL